VGGGSGGAAKTLCTCRQCGSAAASSKNRMSSAI
jgi:hypothetical protein